MQILLTFLTQEALVFSLNMKFVLSQLKHLVKDSQQNPVCSFYKLSDLYGGILINMHMYQYDQTPTGGGSSQPRQKIREDVCVGGGLNSLYLYCSNINLPSSTLQYRNTFIRIFLELTKKLTLFEVYLSSQITLIWQYTSY